MKKSKFYYLAVAILAFIIAMFQTYESLLFITFISIASISMIVSIIITWIERILLIDPNL